MRYLFGFLCVCALGLMPLVGCETTDNGGTGGTAGGGGSAGGGGTGGGVVSSCVDVENFTPCRVGDITGFCHEADCLPTDCSNLDDGVGCVPEPDRCCGVCEDGSCADRVSDCTGFVDWTQCAFVGNDGICIEDGCVPTDCDGLEDGTECFWMGPLAGGYGLCIEDGCVPIDCETDADCTDYKDCTADTCLDNGLCENVAVENGTPCAGGTCLIDECVLETTVLPCTEQGIRNAIAAGGGPYTFDCGGPTTVTVAPGPGFLPIDHSVILDGEGNLTIEGARPSVEEGVQATLSRMAVNMSIHNHGTLTLTNCIVSRGGIRNDGDGALTLIDSTVSGALGTGIVSFSETVLTLISSTVSGNGDANTNRGGIFAQGETTLINSTVSGNVGDFVGGIDIDGTATLINSTVSGNAPGEDIDLGFDSTLTITNSIVDGDCVVGPAASVEGNGYNIESPGDTCGFDESTDLYNVSADELKLGELAANGGPTMTHALGAGSVAIDVIPADMCEVTEDQRGFPRNSMCDVGAFEAQP